MTEASHTRQKAAEDFQLMEVLEELLQNRIRGVSPILDDTATLWLIENFLRDVVLANSGWPWKNMADLGKGDDRWIDAGLSDLWKWLVEKLPASDWLSIHQNLWRQGPQDEELEQSCRRSFKNRLYFLKRELGKSWRTQKEREQGIVSDPDIEHHGGMSTPGTSNSHHGDLEHAAPKSAGPDDKALALAGRLVRLLETEDGLTLNPQGLPPDPSTLSAAFFECELWRGYPAPARSGPSASPDWNQVKWAAWRGIPITTANDRIHKKLRPLLSSLLEAREDAKWQPCEQAQHVLDLLRQVFYRWKPELVQAERFLPLENTLDHACD